MRETPETDRTNTQPEPPARIDKLIAELCPDGVDAGYIKLGRGKVISKKGIAANPGNYPIY